MSKRMRKQYEYNYEEILDDRDQNGIVMMLERG